MSKATTVEKNGRFYKRETGEILTENELLKEWLVIANEQLEDYKSRCEKTSDKLGNYKHYLTPTEEQNSENEDIVDSALNILQNGSDDNG